MVFEYSHWLNQNLRAISESNKNSTHFAEMITDPEFNFGFADYLIYKLPEPRLEYYEEVNFNHVKEKIINEQDKLIKEIGYYPVAMQNPLLDEVALFQIGTLFLGLIFDVIIVLFTIIAILLIYSLLMITVATKTHDSGMMRMLGLSKYGFVGSIMLQSILFVVPSLLVGYVLSLPCIHLVYQWLFKGNAADYDLPVTPSVHATLFSLTLGIIIPTVSAIIPIKVALQSTIVESLDTSRSKTKGVQIDVTDDFNEGQITSMLIGGMMCFYGASIYYFLPASLLNFNLTLLLSIFFLILLGMLLGLTLLAFNF